MKKILLPIFAAALGLYTAREAKAQVPNANESSYWGLMNEMNGNPVPSNLIVRPYTDNGTPADTTDDFSVGSGKTTGSYYDATLLWDNPETGINGVKAGDSVYFKLDDGKHLIQTYMDNGKTQTKIPVPESPGHDQNLDLYVNLGDTITTGVNDRKLSGFKVYPVPTDGRLNVDLDDGDFVKSVSIFGTDGRILEYNMNKTMCDVYQLNVEGLVPGNYFITVESSSGKTGTTQFVKH